MSGQVCTGISGFPDAEDPDRFLARLGTSRTEVIRDLGRLRRNLEQVKPEGKAAAITYKSSQEQA